MNESASVTNSSAVNKTSTAIVENENYTIPYILKQLEQITADTGYIHNALAKLDSNSSGSLGIGLGNLVGEREQTNRKLINFYEKIYDDLCGIERVNLDQYIDKLFDAINACSEDESTKIKCLCNTLEEVLKVLQKAML